MHTRTTNEQTPRRRRPRVVASYRTYPSTEHKFGSRWSVVVFTRLPRRRRIRTVHTHISRVPFRCAHGFRESNALKAMRTKLEGKASRVPLARCSNGVQDREAPSNLVVYSARSVFSHAAPRVRHPWCILGARRVNGFGPFNS